MPVTTLPMLDFLLGKPARKTPVKPYRFESWGAGYYRVASRGSGNTLGYVAKVEGNLWQAEVPGEYSGDGSIYATLTTRAEAGEWVNANTKLRTIDR